MRWDQRSDTRVHFVAESVVSRQSILVELEVNTRFNHRVNNDCWERRVGLESGGGLGEDN